MAEFDAGTKPIGRYAGIIALIAIGKVIFGTDFGAVNVALASIAKDLQLDPRMMSWVVATYSVAYAGFLVLGGRAADTFGRRRFCIFGLLLFCVGSLLAMSAINFWMLIVARALEGLGSAFFIPASFSLINVLLPEGPVRRRGFTVFAATQGLAMIMGLCGGGIVTTMFGWRAVFFITLPLVVVALFLAWRYIPPFEKADKRTSLDIGGAVLITAGAVLLLSGLSALGEAAWLRAGTMLGSAGVVLAVFLLLERRLRDPLVPPVLYRFPRFVGAAFASVFAMAATGGLFLLLNLFMQRVLHFSAMTSGLGMLPYATAVIVGSRLVGHGMARYPLRNVILTGFVVFIAGIALFTGVSLERGYGLGLVPAMIVVGLGGTVASILLMALSTAAVPAPMQGVATGVLVTFQQIGLALGAPVVLAVVTAGMKSGPPVEAFSRAFMAPAVLAAAGLCCTLFLTHPVLAGARGALSSARRAPAKPS